MGAYGVDLQVILGNVNSRYVFDIMNLITPNLVLVLKTCFVIAIWD